MAVFHGRGGSLAARASHLQMPHTDLTNTLTWGRPRVHKISHLVGSCKQPTHSASRFAVRNGQRRQLETSRWATRTYSSTSDAIPPSSIAGWDMSPADADQPTDKPVADTSSQARAPYMYNQPGLFFTSDVIEGRAQESDTQIWQNTFSDADVFMAESDPGSMAQSRPLEGHANRTRQWLNAAVKAKSVDGVLKAIHVHGNSAETQAMLSSLEFSSVLHLVCSDRYIKRVIRQHAVLSQNQSRTMRLKPLGRVLKDWSNAVGRLAYRQLKFGAGLSLRDYGNLLSVCYATGSAARAQTFWSWMNVHEVRPDTICAQHYLGAHVWNDLLPEHRMKRRTESFNLAARDNPQAGPPFDAYLVGRDGIKQTTARILEEISAAGIAFNEAIICHAMVGMAREGDIAGMEKLLAKTWDVHSHRIMTGDDTSPKVPAARGSSLRPSTYLLQTLAFCHGMNAEIPKALRIIDYVSRHYGVVIEANTATTLTFWAYGTSRPWSNESDLEPGAVIMIADTLRAAPYHVQPTIEMIDHVVRAWWTLDNPKKMLMAMDEGRKYAVSAWKRFEAETHRLRKLVGNGRLPPDAFQVEQCQKRVDSLKLHKGRCNASLKDWSKLFLTVGRETMTDESYGFRMVPGLVADPSWHRHLPLDISYYTTTGHVRLKKATGREVLVRHAQKSAGHQKRMSVMNANKRALGHEWVHTRYSNKRLEKLEGALESQSRRSSQRQQ